MRRLATVLLVLATVLPVIPLLVWSVSSSWRYPALVPEETTARGLSIVLSREVLGALGTNAKGASFAFLPTSTEDGFGLAAVRIGSPPAVDEPELE